MVLKTPDGRTVFRYMTKKPADTKLTANSVCCLFPVKTPSGEDVVEFAPVDHPHHRGVFLTWHAMEGKKPADFWGWGELAPTKDRVIQSRGVKLLKADAKGAEIAVRNAWVAEGETMIEEATTIAAREVKGAYVIDLDFRLTPTSDVTLRQTAFSGFCVKSRKDGKAAYYDPEGRGEAPRPAPPQARDRLAGRRLVRLHDPSSTAARRSASPCSTIPATRPRCGTTSPRSPCSTRASWPRAR